MMLGTKPVLVTGATGFIGGRLIEKLILDEGTPVRALVRDFAHASRIARFTLEMCGGAITDAEALHRAVAGCEVVFHCAHDSYDPQGNITGARLLAEACVRHGVTCLVYVSSVSVYEPLPDGELDESASAEPCGWTYQDNKRAVEGLLLQFGREHGLATVALQPTIVYGPFCKPWTMGPLIRLRTGSIVLPGDKMGVCNPVYVDDVVDALLLCATKRDAIGQRFLISGRDFVTWQQFYGAYEEMLGKRAVVLMSTEEIQNLSCSRSVAWTFKHILLDPRHILSWPPLRAAYGLARRYVIGDDVVRRAKQALPPSLDLPNEALLALFRAQTVVRSDKARRLLGYEPAFDFRRGMELTSRFVAWARL
jgi:nucleoside-diphosphate-sugar epimerase